MLLDNLSLFIRIVEKGGLASAGRELGLAPATVTERLAALEEYYGARLLTRTTRSVSLTDEGRELVAGARRILAEAEDTKARIRLGVDQISGVVRLTSTIDLGRTTIVPLIDSFIDRHPGITVDLYLTDKWVDVVREGIDFAIRLGNLTDSSLQSRRVNSNRRIVCASPDYLAARGTPQHPDDLISHNCLLNRFGQRLMNDWRFVVDGKLQSYFVNGNRIANDGQQLRDWSLDGYGIALKSCWDVGEDIAAGRLVELLGDYAPEPSSLQFVYPKGPDQPRRVRLLMDHISATFSKRQMQ